MGSALRIEEHDVVAGTVPLITDAARRFSCEARRAQRNKGLAGLAAKLLYSGPRGG